MVASLTIATPGWAADDTLLAEYNYYESGKIELNAGNYQQAITHYANLQRLFPDSLYIPQALLESAYAYYKLGDADAAIGQLQEFLGDDNRHPHKPYAFYLAGLSRYQEALRLLESATSAEGTERAREATRQALDYFSRLVDKFPDSLYSGDARQKSTYLLEKLVLHRIKTEEESASVTRQRRIETESDRAINWLMKQPANQFTLQLVRSPDYDTTFSVAQQYKLEKGTAIIETETADGKGYTLLYGIYGSKHDAMEAGAALPTPILQTQPLVRELASLQAEIVESRLIQAGMKRESIDVPQIRQAPPQPAEPVPAVSSKNIPRTAHERWLLSQKPTAFTVQLMGSGSEDNLLAFINDNNLSGQTYYYRTKRKDGSSWYSLLYGSYPDKNAATEAARQIGNRLGVAQPWIRSFKGIQSEINN